MPIRTETVVLLQLDQSVVFFIEAVLHGSRYCRVMPFPEVNLSEHVDRPIAIVSLEGSEWVALPVAQLLVVSCKKTESKTFTLLFDGAEADYRCHRGIIAGAGIHVNVNR